MKSNTIRWIMYKRFEDFMSGEPVSNGSHVGIGTDRSGLEDIASSDEDLLRAYGMRDNAASYNFV